MCMLRSASRNDVGKNALQKNACRKRVSELRLPKKKHVATAIKILNYFYVLPIVAQCLVVQRHDHVPSVCSNHASCLMILRLLKPSFPVMISYCDRMTPQKSICIGYFLSKMTHGVTESHRCETGEDTVHPNANAWVT